MTYEIGYRRPPAAARFKSGKSGNPKGRPKGSRNFLTLLEDELAGKVVVTENGRKKTVTRLQAMVKRMVAGALQGDQKGLMALVEVLRRAGRFDRSGSEIADLLPDNYEEILETYVSSRKPDQPRTPGQTTDQGRVGNLNAEIGDQS